MQIHHGGKDCHLARGVLPRRIHSAASRFWKVYRLHESDSDDCFYATQGGEVIGFFRFSCGHPYRFLFANGTWVAPEYRNQGLASALWQKALDSAIASHPLQGVNVFVASKLGRRLVSKLKGLPKYEQLIWIDGGTL